MESDSTGYSVTYIVTYVHFSVADDVPIYIFNVL